MPHERAIDLILRDQQWYSGWWARPLPSTICARVTFRKTSSMQRWLGPPFVHEYFARMSCVPIWNRFQVI